MERVPFKNTFMGGTRYYSPTPSPHEPVRDNHPQFVGLARLSQCKTILSLKVSNEKNEEINSVVQILFVQFRITKDIKTENSYTNNF